MKGCKKAFAFAGLLGLSLLVAPAAKAADAVHDATAKARGNMNLALGHAEPTTVYRSYSVAPTTQWASPAVTNVAPRSYSYAPATQWAPYYGASVYRNAPRVTGYHDAGAKVRGTFGL